MAFTGTATIKQVSDREVRITGLSLAAGAAGTIGLTGKTVAADVTLPEGFQPKAYTGPDGTTVGLSDSIDVTNQPAAVGTATAIPVATVKTGTDATDWVATLTNTHASTATPDLEIYVKFHD